MYNILFYGNCQLFAILKTLNLSKEYVITNIRCWNNDINEEYFRNVIINSNIIITQHINDNYRNVDYLSTSYIVKHKIPTCKLIIIDSCYFDFYYFDLTYIQFNNEVLHNPIDYHYNKMIECYKNNQTIEYYINNFVNNLHLKSTEELDNIANNSLNKLYLKYMTNKEKYSEPHMYVIQTYDYIKNNYKNKLLFYSINHPTKYLIQFISEKIVDILQIKNTIDYNIDVLNSPKCILYKCILKNINFDINEYNPLTLGYTDITQITQLYYDTYKKIDFK